MDDTKAAQASEVTQQVGSVSSFQETEAATTRASGEYYNLNNPYIFVHVHATTMPSNI
jgi:hypothetical protein